MRPVLIIADNKAQADHYTAKQTDNKKTRSKSRKVSEELIWTNEENR